MACTFWLFLQDTFLNETLFIPLLFRISYQTIPESTIEILKQTCPTGSFGAQVGSLCDIIMIDTDKQDSKIVVKQKHMILLYMYRKTEHKCIRLKQTVHMLYALVYNSIIMPLFKIKKTRPTAGPLHRKKNPKAVTTPQ